MAKEHNQQKAELTEEEKRQRLRRVYKLLVEPAEEEKAKVEEPEEKETGKAPAEE